MKAPAMTKENSSAAGPSVTFTGCGVVSLAIALAFAASVYGCVSCYGHRQTTKRYKRCLDRAPMSGDCEAIDFGGGSRSDG